MKQQHWRTLVPALDCVFVCMCGVIDHGADQALDHHHHHITHTWVDWFCTDGHICSGAPFFFLGCVPSSLAPAATHN